LLNRHATTKNTMNSRVIWISISYQKLRTTI
jgi:hypothetical protein